MCNRSKKGGFGLGKINMAFMMTVSALSDSAYCFAAAHRKTENKKGILLVTFGSGMPDTRAIYENVEKKVKAVFPELPIRWAYTSHIIRKKSAKEGKMLDSVETALARMMDEGFTHAALQSLHIIAGREFHDIRVNARAFGNMSGGFRQIFVGYPLLGTPDDMNRAAAAVMNNLPGERKKDEAAVLMGHGTRHPAHAVYPAMMYKFQLKDPNVYIGTAEGEPSVEDIRDMLIKKGIKKAYLIPFMSVAGEHARNDMAGDNEDSWKSILGKAGIACVPVLKGLAEYDEAVDIWIDHLKEIIARFE